MAKPADLEQNWRFYNPTTHLCGVDLNGVDHIVTIDRVELEMVGDDKKDKPILYFSEGGKGMICGSKNSQTIAKLMGSPVLKDWIGKQIQIFGTDEKNFGQVKDVVRVRPFLPKIEEQKEKPVLIIGKKMYLQLCDKIYNEETTLEKAREFFTITDEVQRAIELEIKAREAAENA
jgi:hypothetical protein